MTEMNAKLKKFADLTRTMLGGLDFTWDDLEHLLDQSGIEGITADPLIEYGVVGVKMHDYWVDKVYARYTPMEFAARMNQSLYQPDEDAAPPERMGDVFVEWDAKSKMFCEKTRTHTPLYHVID